MLAENTISCTILLKTFINYQFCVFVMVNCLLLRFKFRESNSPKCDVNFQKSLCHDSENRMTRIFLQINLCFITLTPLRACTNVISFLQ